MVIFIRGALFCSPKIHWICTQIQHFPALLSIFAKKRSLKVALIVPKKTHSITVIEYCKNILELRITIQVKHSNLNLNPAFGSETQTLWKNHLKGLFFILHWKESKLEFFSLNYIFLFWLALLLTFWYEQSDIFPHPFICPIDLL